MGENQGKTDDVTFVRRRVSHTPVTRIGHFELTGLRSAKRFSAVCSYYLLLSSSSFRLHPTIWLLRDCRLHSLWTMRQWSRVIRSSRTNPRSSHSETDLPRAKTLHFLPSDAGCIYPCPSFGTLCLRHLHKVPVIVSNLRVLRSNWSNKFGGIARETAYADPGRLRRLNTQRGNHIRLSLTRVTTRSEGIELGFAFLQPPAVVALVFVTELSRSQGFQSCPSPSSSRSLCRTMARLFGFLVVGGPLGLSLEQDGW